MTVLIAEVVSDRETFFKLVRILFLIETMCDMSGTEHSDIESAAKRSQPPISLPRRKRKKVVRQEKEQCVVCKVECHDVEAHFFKCHQGSASSEEASLYGYKFCACGRLAKSLDKHWKTGCPLPASEQRERDTVLGSDFEILELVLANETPSTCEVRRAFEALARIPPFARVFSPPETRVINECMTRLCQSYVRSRREIDLLRILALPKTVCHPRLSRKFSDLTKRLRVYPQVHGLSVFEVQRKRSSADRPLRDRVEQKVAQGRVAQAAKLLEDSLGVADASPETVDKLRSLHPQEEEHLWNSQVEHEVQLDVEQVRKALCSISSDTTGGPSGMDGRFVLLFRHNEAFHSFLVMVGNAMLRGSQPGRHMLLGARSIPLKKDAQGGVRPIGITETIYRVCARAIVRRTSVNLLPFQFGVGSPLGVEPVVELARKHGSSRSVISFDFRNAFNSLRRDLIWQGVSDFAPDLLPLFEWAYGQHTWLYLEGRKVLKAESGVLQGDPLAPVLFSLGLRRPLEELKLRLEEAGITQDDALSAYLDDVNVMAVPSLETVATETVTSFFQALEPCSGLQLRPEKTKVSRPKDFKAKGFGILGTHVGGKAKKFLTGKKNEVRQLLEKLRDVRYQDAYLLVTRCVRPKLTSFLRTLSLRAEHWVEVDNLFTDHVIPPLTNIYCFTYCFFPLLQFMTEKTETKRSKYSEYRH